MEGRCGAQTELPDGLDRGDRRRDAEAAVPGEPRQCDNDRQGRDGVKRPVRSLPEELRSVLAHPGPDRRCDHLSLPGSHVSGERGPGRGDDALVGR
jgi:hypothetical protein